MSDVAPGPDHPESPRLWLPPNPEPRSPVLRGLLYAASGITWSIAATTLATMWENTPFMQTMVSYAGWLFWPAGLAIALYVAHRGYLLVVGPAPGVDAAIRNGELVPPATTEPESRRWRRPASEASAVTTTPSKELRNARVLMLRALWAATGPGTTSAAGGEGTGEGDGDDAIVVDTDAILAVYDSVVAAFESGIRRSDPKTYQALCHELRTNVSVVLGDLVRTGDLHQRRAHRYLLPHGRRRRHQAARLRPPGRAGDGAGRDLEELTLQALEAALPALLRHFADLAERWAGALEHRRHSAAAGRWFTDREPTLRKLILRCEPSPHQRAAVAGDIAQLADALDRWYVRERLWRPALEVAQRIEQLAGSAEKPVLRDLSALRRRTARRLTEGPRERQEADETSHAPLQAPRRHRLAVALHARELHENALANLVRLGGPGSTGGPSTGNTGPANTSAENPPGPANTSTEKQPPDLTEIERRLQGTWRNLPRAEVGNVVATLINLALVHLYQGRLQSADDRLDLAESLTRNDIAPAQRAHAREVRGVVAWTRGVSRRATSLWYDAWSLFRELGIDHGRSRCARHLAGALRKDPGLDRVLDDLAADDPSALRALRQEIRHWQSQGSATDESARARLLKALGSAGTRALDRADRARRQILRRPRRFLP